MTSADHDFYMSKALALAEHAGKQGEVPVGAVVVINGDIVGEGFNQPISSNDPTAHAEVVALRDAAANLQNYRLPNAVLYVTLEPCTMCAGSMVHARIKTLVYAAAEPKSGVVNSCDHVFDGEHLNHRVDVVSGVLADQASTLLKDFFKRRRS